RVAHRGPIEDDRGDAAVALHQDLVAHACLLGCRSGRRRPPVDVVDVAGIVPDLPSPSPNFGGMVAQIFGPACIVWDTRGDDAHRSPPTDTPAGDPPPPP